MTHEWNKGHFKNNDGDGDDDVIRSLINSALNKFLNKANITTNNNTVPLPKTGQKEHK